MKIGIIYYSRTGNTKKLAEIAFDLLKGMLHEVSLFSIENFSPENEQQFDLLIIGSYCDSNNYPKKVHELFASLTKNKHLASFVTHSTYSSGPYYQAWAAGSETFYDSYCSENNVVNKGYFHCQGKPSRAISLFIRSAIIKDKGEWKEFKADMNNHPNEQEIVAFKAFIHSIIPA
jgi:flavodoxin